MNEIQAQQIDDWPRRSMVYMVRVSEPVPVDWSAYSGYFGRNLGRWCTDNLMDTLNDHIEAGACLCDVVTAIPVGDWPAGRDLHEHERADLVREAERLEQMAKALRGWAGA